MKIHKLHQNMSRECWIYILKFVYNKTCGRYEIITINKIWLGKCPCKNYLKIKKSNVQNVNNLWIKITISTTRGVLYVQHCRIKRRFWKRWLFKVDPGKFNGHCILNDLAIHPLGTHVFIQITVGKIYIFKWMRYLVSSTYSIYQYI